MNENNLTKNNIVNEHESNRQIKKGALISYVSIGVNIVFGLLYTPWMVQQIGSSDYGLYMLANSLIAMFMIDFGLSSAVSKYISEYNAKGDQQKVNNLLGITYKLYLLIDIFLLIAAIVVFFNINSIYQELTFEEIEKFKVIYLIAVSFSLFSFPFITLDGIMTSYENFFELKLCDLFNKISSVILIVFALLNDYGLYTLVAMNAISGIITIFSKLAIVKVKVPIKINFLHKDKKMLREIFSFSIWTGIIGISQRLIFNITPTILGAISGTVSISIFGIASSLEGYVYTFAAALNGLFLPKVTRIMNSKNANHNFLQLMIKIGRIQLLIIGLLTIGFISIGKDFIILWMGKEFVSSFYSAVLLILPSLLYLPQQLGNIAVVAKSKVKLQASVFIVMALLNIVLSLIFSYYWGALGASLAISISYFIRSFGMNIIFYKALEIDIYTFFKETYFPMVIPLLISLIVGLILNILIVNVSWLNLLIKGFVVVLLFSVIAWTQIMNKYEKNMITIVIKNK